MSSNGQGSGHPIAQPQRPSNFTAPSPTPSSHSDGHTQANATLLSTASSSNNMTMPLTTTTAITSTQPQQQSQPRQQLLQHQTHPAPGVFVPSVGTTGAAITQNGLTNSGISLGNNNATAGHNNATVNLPPQQQQSHVQHLFNSVGSVAHPGGEGRPVMSIAVSSDVAKQLMQYANMGLFRQHQIPLQPQSQQQQLHANPPSSAPNNGSSGGVSNPNPSSGVGAFAVQSTAPGTSPLMSIANGFQFHQNAPQTASFANQLQALGYQRLQEMQRLIPPTYPSHSQQQQQSNNSIQATAGAIASSNAGEANSISSQKKRSYNDSTVTNEVLSSKEEDQDRRRRNDPSSPREGEYSVGSDQEDSEHHNQKPAKSNFTIMPCRARGMPMEHNFQNAYLRIPEDIQHGEGLVCSFPACRNKGIKFVYCAYCHIPVTKRNFRYKHSHDDLKPDKDKTNDGAHANKKAKILNNGASNKTSTAAVVSSSNGASSSDRSSSLDNDDGSGGRRSHKKRPASDLATSSTAATAIVSNKSRGSSGGRHNLGHSSLYPLFAKLAKFSPERQVAWANMLISRPRSSQEAHMSQWLMQIMAVSDTSKPLPKSSIDLSDLSSFVQTNVEQPSKMAEMTTIMSMRCSSPVEEEGSSASFASSTNQSSSEDITSSSSGSSSKSSTSPSSSPSPSNPADDIPSPSSNHLRRDIQRRKHRHKLTSSMDPPKASTLLPNRSSASSF